MNIAITAFQRSVYKATSKIPRGKVSTYFEIAQAIGRPKAARAIGNALHTNPFAPKVPCHRVVRSDGSLGGFFLGQEKKLKILKKEGVICRLGKIIDFDSKFIKLTRIKSS